MPLFSSLLGFLTGGAAAAAGAWINSSNKKKRWDAYQAQEQTKLDTQCAFAQSIKNIEDEETRADRKKLEALIGTTVEEDLKKRRYYNLPLEYDLTMQYLSAMKASYRKEHPPGSQVKLFRSKPVCNYSTAAQQVMHDNVAEYQTWFLPYPEQAYDHEVESAFWKQSLDSYKGPQKINGKQYVVTYFVGPGTYALGKARKELIRRGYLPSNCRSHLWVNWSPYVRWLGEEWNDEFHTGVDLGHYFDSTWFTPTPQNYEKQIHETQAAYERQHPEHFSGGIV